MGLMNAKELAERLKEGICKITYTHYKTGEPETATLTLASGYTGISIVGHDAKSDVVVGYDIYGKEWKSIYMKTITEVLDVKTND